jgi:hypothetical protein
MMMVIEAMQKIFNCFDNNTAIDGTQITRNANGEEANNEYQMAISSSPDITESEVAPAIVRPTNQQVVAPDQCPDDADSGDSAASYDVIDKREFSPSGINCATEIIDRLNSVVIDKKNKLLAFPFYGIHTVKIISIYDADTIKVLFMFRDQPVLTNVRIEGIDSAEIKSKVTEIKEFAAITRDFIKDLLPVGTITTAFFKKWDKFGGRVIGSVNIGNKNICDILLETRMAVAYKGATKITDTQWCEFINTQNDERIELCKKIKSELNSPF